MTVQLDRLVGLADGEDSLDEPVGQAGGAGWYRTIR